MGWPLISGSVFWRIKTKLSRNYSKYISMLYVIKIASYYLLKLLVA